MFQTIQYLHLYFLSIYSYTYFIWTPWHELSTQRVMKDIHLAVFISHLDLLFCDTRTKVHYLLLAWWLKRFLPNCFTVSKPLFDSFCQRSKLYLQRPRTSILPKGRIHYWIHNSLLRFTMKPCQGRTSPEDKPRVSLAVSNWNTKRHPTSTVCCVVLVLGAVSQSHIRTRTCVSFDGKSEAWTGRSFQFLPQLPCLSNVTLTFNCLQIRFQY